MAELRQNTWTLDAWYDQDVAGNVSYSGAPAFYSWGGNDEGGLGQNNPAPGDDRSSPVQLPGTTWSKTLDKMVCGFKGSSVIKTDGTLWAWGYNSYGELGLSSNTQYSSPKQVTGTTWSTISRGYEFMLATKTDGTLWASGRNYHGQIGQNQPAGGGSSPTAYYNSPAQIGGAVWKTDAGGMNGNKTSGVAIRTDGTLWTWGMNQYSGCLGHNNTTNYSSPKQVPGTDWNIVGRSMQNRTAIIKTDGSLWMMGNNPSGSLGQNNNTAYSSPTQIGTGTTWSRVCTSGNFTVALKTTGTLWIWGSSSNGQLAQNVGPGNNRSSPIQIPGTTWNDCNIADKQAFATKTDGTLWTWGENQIGELGQNQAEAQLDSLSSPTQIPGNWPIAACGGFHSAANILGVKEL